MQIDPDDFKRHYALLSDAALLEINADELVNAARPHYDAELAERKLSTPNQDTQQEEIAAETGDRPHDALHQVATFLSLDEANFARGLLHSAEIACSFENEHRAAWAGTGELRLMVPASEYDRACEILQYEISDEDLIAQAEAEVLEDGEPR